MSVDKQLLKKLGAFDLLHHSLACAKEILRRASADDPDLLARAEELDGIAQLWSEIAAVVGDDAIAKGAVDAASLDTRPSIDAIATRIALAVTALYRVRTELVVRLGVIDPSIVATIDRALRGALADAQRRYGDDVRLSS